MENIILENAYINRVAISNLIYELGDLKNKNKKGYVDNIPKAIHNALMQDGML